MPSNRHWTVQEEIVLMRSARGKFREGKGKSEETFAEIVSEKGFIGRTASGLKAHYYTILRGNGLINPDTLKEKEQPQQEEVVTEQFTLGIELQSDDELFQAFDILKGSVASVRQGQLVAEQRVKELEVELASERQARVKAEKENQELREENGIYASVINKAREAVVKETIGEPERVTLQAARNGDLSRVG